ncbi:MAG: type II toxin-antitoxin system PemK/MazF family toxin [Ilumatobacteraceae bacterium]
MPGRTGRMSERALGADHRRRHRPMRRGRSASSTSTRPARSEADKRRPAVIVNSDGANATAGDSVTAWSRSSRSSNVTRVNPFQVLLDAATTRLDRDCKAQAEQVRSVDVERVGARIAVLDQNLVAELDEALRLHLAL